MRFCLKLKVENVEQSTFFYKLIDSRPAALIEDNEKTVAFFLERSRAKTSASKEKVCTEEGK